MSDDSFDARADLEVGGRSYEIYRLGALQQRYDVARLPFSLKVLLENLLRNEDGTSVRKEDIEALASGAARPRRCTKVKPHKPTSDTSELNLVRQFLRRPGRSRGRRAFL